MNELLLTYAIDFLVAILLLVFGWLAAAWARRLIRRALEGSGRIDPTLRPVIASAVRYLILVVVLVAVLAKFGIQTASILAVLGAAGLAIGLSLQGTLSNVASGFMLLCLRPFGVSDYVDVEGTAGTVREIGLFTTELETYDGVYVMIPNAQVFGRTIKNYSRLPYRRIDVTVGISYGDDIEKAFAAAFAVLKGDARVRPDPAPQVMVAGLGDSAVNLNLRCWTGRDDYWDLLFDLQKAIKLRLDADGITIPFPQRDVHLIAQKPA